MLHQHRYQGCVHCHCIWVTHWLYNINTGSTWETQCLKNMQLTLEHWEGNLIGSRLTSEDYVLPPVLFTQSSLADGNLIFYVVLSGMPSHVLAFVCSLKHKHMYSSKWVIQANSSQRSWGRWQNMWWDVNSLNMLSPARLVARESNI